MTFILTQQIPLQEPDEKKVKKLTLDQKLYWVFVYRTAQQHPKKWYDQTDDKAAKLFEHDRTTIVGWNKKLDNAGCITYARKDEINPVTKRKLPNRFFVAQPTPEVLAQIVTVTHGLAPEPSEKSNTEPSEKSNTAPEVSHPDENTRDDSKSDKQKKGSTHVYVPSSTYTVNVPIYKQSANAVRSKQLDVENPTRLWKLPPSSATTREQRERLLQAKREQLEHWKALDLPAPGLEHEIKELERLIAGGEQ